MANGEFEDQIRQMIASLSERRDQAAKPYDEAIRWLETIAHSVAPVAPTPVEIQRRSKESSAARTRRIITLIMKETGQPISISTIADRAHTSGLLTSKRGYKGVYADVARVLIRNQHLFAKTGERGFWKLKVESISTAPKQNNGDGTHGLFGRIMVKPDGSMHALPTPVRVPKPGTVG